MENTTTATVTESAPTSTADITANVITELEAQDTSGDTSEGYVAPSTEAVEVKADPATAPTQAELSAAAKFLQKQGHQMKKVDGRPVWLPINTVEKMLDRYVDEHRQTWTGERTTLESQANEIRQHFAELRAGIEGDPRAFLSELAGIDPRYQAFLEPAAREASTVTDERPKPDVDLGNGSWTYSPDQNDKLIEWKARQLIDARMKPIEERDKAAQAKAEETKTLDAIRERTSTQMQDAQTWPLFGALSADGALTPFQQEVLDELRKDSDTSKAAGRRASMSMRQAYLEVLTRHQEPDKVRERALADINSAPRSTAVSSGNPDGRANAKPRTTNDIARQVITTLEKGS